ncbi:SPOR domain-containing protein [Iodidimonas gelatinilytica]|uniref:SPOR domain-containing protein n=1 Tax=Iodidimonas gelatinilytica TaxID=1236966 RepID=UPI001B2FF3E3|nr:SPOR domain-containing protein [Iodidimonas gelatinilytica]
MMRHFYLIRGLMPASPFCLAVSLLCGLSACASAPQTGPAPIGLYHPSAPVEPESAADTELASSLTYRVDQQARQLKAIDDALVDITGKLGGVGGDPAADIAAIQQDVRGLSDKVDRLMAQLNETDRAVATIMRRLDMIETATVGAVKEAAAARDLVNRVEGVKAAQEGYELEAGPGQSYAIHLASYQNPAAAKEGWEVLKGQYPAVLEHLSPRLDPLRLDQAGGQFLRLIAGPFADISPAREACENLRQQGAFCQLSLFRGEGL